MVAIASWQAAHCNSPKLREVCAVQKGVTDQAICRGFPSNSHSRNYNRRYIYTSPKLNGLCCLSHCPPKSEKTGFRRLLPPHFRWSSHTDIAGQLLVPLSTHPPMNATFQKCTLINQVHQQIIIHIS